jgi:hypothetical protein
MNETLKQYLVSECKTVADFMESAETDRDRLFYFSAVHAAAQRVANMEYSSSLIHLWVVGQWAHNTLTGRFGVVPQITGLPPSVQIQSGPPHLPEVPIGITSSLTSVVKELAARLEKDAEYGDLLAAMCEIAYATTGNGFYLLKSGRLNADAGGTIPR